MTVVSNASPLIALAAINSLDLLQALYGSIHIPEEVYTEVVIRGQSPAAAIATIPWIVRHVITDRQSVARLRTAGLDQGESEAIALALELSANLLIVDERLARSIARQHGLKITGAIGVLIAAKDAGIVTAIKPLLAQLVATGFYISPQLIAQVLQVAGE